MYGKFFASTFEGSMMAAGPEVFSVWAYVIAKACNGKVELNPRLLAAVIGSTPEKMKLAIEQLCAPDADSRTKAEDGRRLLYESGFQYEVVNHKQYRAITNEEERRDYFAKKKREQRARDETKSDVKNVFDSQRLSTMSTHTEEEEETKKKTTPPTPKGESPGFIEFWKAWPKSNRKGEKEKCSKVWKSLSLETELKEILAHVAAMSKSQDWLKEAGQYIPAPLVYLRNKKWSGADLGASVSIFAGCI